jgi:hypothetical protein
MSQKQKEPVAESKIIAVDLAKDVFEVALANAAHRVVSRQRLRGQSCERSSIPTRQPWS